jgi:hypothetical protein
MESRGMLLKPIVVDRDTRVILDGHCRCGALKRIGCSRVAVRFVNYMSDRIDVEGWDGRVITKSEVVEAGLKGHLMMPKTSKHMVRRCRKRMHISEICDEVRITLSDLA